MDAIELLESVLRLSLLHNLSANSSPPRPCISLQSQACFTKSIINLFLTDCPGTNVFPATPTGQFAFVVAVTQTFFWAVSHALRPFLVPTNHPLPQSDSLEKYISPRHLANLLASFLVDFLWLSLSL
ncbi:hypothetical protein O181_004436 [Austropuccinia psidii MF-1]|uniref:Uncharacterized protein n=1 Tax=Austropuccinia psidii MF-1 TaxID=1389203 RepID=A0A9Q3BGW5_9BASI|nr:hypothetical protein [Austropuccinia psidii MF-1]